MSRRALAPVLNCYRNRPLAWIDHDLNHEILERHESLEVESNAMGNTVSFHARTGMSRNLSHRILPFVCFVYFVVKNPGLRVLAHLARESRHPQLLLPET